MITYNSVKARLVEAEQSHLLQFWDDLTNHEKDNFLYQLAGMNFHEYNKLFQNALSALEQNCEKLDKRMKPIPPTQCGSVENSTPEALEKYKDIGLDEIANGHVGVLLLAGGQGTRLGVSYPKGMYSIGLPSNSTLFQVQAERIKKIQEMAEIEFKRKAVITWYIMTSGPTGKATTEFLKCSNYFGLKPENIVQFDQGVLPCFDMKGRILLEKKDQLSFAPDGNGGIYRALQEKGILADMQKRGILYLHVYGVDNILIKVADPIFIGYCINKGADCGAKVVRKDSPSEAVGVVCQVDNRFQVVEYSEITESTANLKDDKGNLVFSSGNICNHFFSTNFLQQIANQYEKHLKLHVAKKKIPFLNEFGEIEKPDRINGIKIEKFIFDVFQFSKNFVTWEVPRYSEFSALKNSNEAGKDCPITARKDLYRLHKYYIESAGGVVRGDIVEISPLLSYAGENLKNVVKGNVLYSPVLLTPRDFINND